MFKLLSLLTVSLLAASANAEIFYCNYNDPMITVALDTQTGMVKWTDAYRNEFATSVESVTITDTAVGASFWRGNDYHRMAIDLTTWGSVPRSNWTYPTRGELLNYWVDSFGFYHSLVGGCYSAERPRTCAYDRCY